uniref:Putative salivary lipocalin n=1 Tax=Ixodes ricinus TaxID=34613 RepID=A0A6B0V7Q1_IXORI
MALRNFVLCVSVATSFAIKFDLKERSSDNNPDLNRQDLGIMQDAWEVIKNTQKEVYYMMYVNEYNYNYNSKRCIQLRTSDLNQTLKTAVYNLTWNKYDRWCKRIEEQETWISQVAAIKQNNYYQENILRFWYPNAADCGSRTADGSYNLVDYSNYQCDSGLQDPTYFSHYKEYYDSYVVYSEQSCYVLRTLERSGVCEFWLSEILLNKTLTELESQQKEESDEDRNTGDCITESNAEEKLNLKLFRNLPRNCRVAFLLSCGDPETLMYNKTECENSSQIETTPQSKDDD